MLKAEDKKPEVKITEVLIIAIEEGTGKVMVRGMLANRKPCLNCLGEAIKVVANFDAQPKRIIKPNVRFQKPGGILNFVRRRK